MNRQAFNVTETKLKIGNRNTELAVKDMRIIKNLG